MRIFSRSSSSTSCFLLLPLRGLNRSLLGNPLLGVGPAASFSAEALRELPKGWNDNLYNRVMCVGDPRVPVAPLLEAWVAKGNTVEKSYLQGMIKQMKSSRRYTHGLEGNFSQTTMKASLLLHRRALSRALVQPSGVSPASLFRLDGAFHTGLDNFRQSGQQEETADELEKRLFGNSDNSGEADPFYRKLDELERAGRNKMGSRWNEGRNSQFGTGIGGGFDSLSDGMDEKLERASLSVYNDEIQDEEDYKFRPDMNFMPGDTYTPRDLDLTKPAIPKPFRRDGFETTTEEVLKKADFRNVRFLSNFLTDAGIIIKRSQTRISAKAQRKVAREIKLARAFGLMPFTTMGTKPFAFGRNMKDQDEDYEFYDVSAPGSHEES